MFFALSVFTFTLLVKLPVRSPGIKQLIVKPEDAKQQALVVGALWQITFLAGQQWLQTAALGYILSTACTSLCKISRHQRQ